MGSKMTWEEIKKTFPDEWVAIGDAQGDVYVPFGNIIGNVLLHSPDETIFTDELKSHPPRQKIDIRFTGEVLPDNPVGPVLWQISDTNS